MNSRSEELLARIRMPAGADGVFDAAGARTIVVPGNRTQLIELSLGGEPDRLEVAYDIPHRGRVVEAEVVRARNGVAVNMPEPYMRRRDPDCMVVADQEASDKPRFADRFDTPFQDWRNEIVAWLTEQSLVVLK